MSLSEIEKLRDFEFTDACITFSFNLKKNSELLFFTKTEVFKFDYLDEAKDRVNLYTLGQPLADYPKFGVFDDTQTKFMITSAKDILYVDMEGIDGNKE